MDSYLFAELKQLACTVDRQLSRYKDEIDKPDRQFCYPVVKKKTCDLKRETKQLKSDATAELSRVKTCAASIDDMLLTGHSLLQSMQKQVSDTEQHLEKYGYTPWSEEQVATGGTQATPPNVPQLKAESTNLSQTPQLEACGVSKEFLQYIDSCKKPAKFPASTALPNASVKFPTAVISRPIERAQSPPPSIKREPICSTPPEPQMSCERQHQRYSGDKDLPLIFQHNGILTTPSLFKTVNLNFTNHAVLASPDLPKEPDLYSNHNMAMPKRPVNVGLFQSPAPTDMKYVPVMGYDGTPQEPELTYSLEEMAEMTGMLRINHDKAPASMTKSASGFYFNEPNKENVYTPPEPTLSIPQPTPAVQHMNVMKPEEKITTKNGLPAPPKLMGSYNFL